MAGGREGKVLSDLFFNQLDLIQRGVLRIFEINGVSNGYFVENLLK